MTHTMVKPDVTGAECRRHSFRSLPGTRVLCGWTLFLLLLGWGSSTPAHAESGTIRESRNGPIYVSFGETLNIVEGALISSPDNSCVIVEAGGTLNISGGSVSSGIYGVYVSGGAV